jgi:TetR/AcrR family transcriptional regulator
MRLSAQDRKKQILETATRLFASQGYAATTTRRIASECGVTEALLFRHFPTKEELYWEVIEAKRAKRGFMQSLTEILASEMEPVEVFTALARERLERNFDDPTMMRLLLFSALENRDLSFRFFRTYTVEYHEQLAEYIQHRIDDGTFRRANPLLAARSFLAMLFYHFMIQELFGGKQVQAFGIDEISRHVAEMWLAGMLNSSAGSVQESELEPALAGHFPEEPAKGSRQNKDRKNGTVATA